MGSGGTPGAREPEASPTDACNLRSSARTRPKGCRRASQRQLNQGELAGTQHPIDRNYPGRGVGELLEGVPQLPEPLSDIAIAPPSPSRYRCRLSLSLLPRWPVPIAPVSLSPRRLPYGVSGIRGEEHGEGKSQFCPNVPHAVPTVAVPVAVGFRSGCRCLSVHA